MPNAPRPEPVVCTRCGQRGNERPGFKLGEYDNLEAVFVLDDDYRDTVSVPTPQRLTCLACGKTSAVARGSINVRRP